MGAPVEGRQKSQVRAKHVSALLPLHPAGEVAPSAAHATPHFGAHHGACRAVVPWRLSTHISERFHVEGSTVTGRRGKVPKIRKLHTYTPCTFISLKMAGSMAR